MLIGGDDSNDVITLGTCFSVSVYIRADWRKSDSSVDREPQGNWRWNSNSNDVVASSPSFLPPRRQSAPESLLPDYCYPLKITSPQWFYTKVFTHCFSKPYILSKYLGVSLTTQAFTAAGFYLTQYIKHESTYCTRYML